MLASSSAAGTSLARQPSCCSSLSRTVCSSRHMTRRLLAPAFATNGQQQSEAGPSPAASGAASGADEEARIEALEASIRKAKPKGGAKRQIPIRNMTPRQQEADSTRAEWKANKLFPEGWEQMSLPEKVAELYLGQRGILFWANKAAWASVWVVGGAWVVFRFVGPALGLYKLAGDLSVPPI